MPIFLENPCDRFGFLVNFILKKDIDKKKETSCVKKLCTKFFEVPSFILCLSSENKIKIILQIHETFFCEKKCNQIIGQM